MTISAPSRERITSSTAWRSAVPGAIFSIAFSSPGSRRGSSSDGVRVKPSSGGSRSALVSLVSFGGGLFDIESCANRLADRLGVRHLKCATRRRPLRRDDPGEAELRALLQPPVDLGGRAKPPGEADLAEGGDPGAHRRTPRA